MPRRKLPVDYHTVAAQRGFEWLGPEVSSVNLKTHWKCPQDHEWSAQYASIRRGSGCPYCANNAPKTNADYHRTAEIHSYKWLGPSVSNTQLKTTWECQHGHQWKSRYSDISRGYGCPSCARNRISDLRRKKNLKTIYP